MKYLWITYSQQVFRVQLVFASLGNNTLSKHPSFKKKKNHISKCRIPHCSLPIMTS
jgi:hypothetical protein